MIYLDSEKVDVTIFPDGTSQVWKLDEKYLGIGATSQIRWDFSHEGEIMHLGQLKMLLDLYHQEVHLYIHYLPYGRQDKPVSNTATFALNSFAGFLNLMGFTSVTILDPHSNLLEVLSYAEPIYPESQLQGVCKAVGANLICYPDNGARKKYLTIYDRSRYLPVMFGEKVRDQASGRITNYKLLSEGREQANDQVVLIVDDICDGGATFVILAEALRLKGAKEVHLFVTHGIFSKGIKPLNDAGIGRVFTAEGEVFHDVRALPSRPYSILPFPEMKHV